MMVLPITCQWSDVHSRDGKQQLVFFLGLYFRSPESSSWTMHEYTAHDQTLLIDHKRFMLHELCRGSTAAGSDMYSWVPTLGDLGIEETLANVSNRSLVLHSCTRTCHLLIDVQVSSFIYIVSYSFRITYTCVFNAICLSRERLLGLTFKIHKIHSCLFPGRWS